jgi:Zn-dependent membrane protease YugP
VLIWALVLIPLAAGLLAQRQVRDTFSRYAAVPNMRHVSGAEVARALLDAHRLGGIRVELAPGALTDHYDPVGHALRLSRDVGEGRSVAALGIATHEVAHAYQDAEGSRVYRLRKRIAEPLGKAAPWSGPILFGGILLGNVPLIVLACAYMAGLVAFSVVTLPVELQASRRALVLLGGTHLADDGELPQIRSVLRAAACTYAASVAQQLGFFGALLLIALAMVR